MSCHGRSVFAHYYSAGTAGGSTSRGGHRFDHTICPASSLSVRAPVRPAKQSLESSLSFGDCIHVCSRIDLLARNGDPARASAVNGAFEVEPQHNSVKHCAASPELAHRAAPKRPSYHSPPQTGDAATLATAIPIASEKLEGAQSCGFN